MLQQNHMGCAEDNALPPPPGPPSAASPPQYSALSQMQHGNTGAPAKQHVVCSCSGQHMTYALPQPSFPPTLALAADNPANMDFAAAPQTPLAPCPLHCLFHIHATADSFRGSTVIQQLSGVPIPFESSPGERFCQIVQGHVELGRAVYEAAGRSGHCWLVPCLAFSRRKLPSHALVSLRGYTAALDSRVHQISCVHAGSNLDPLAWPEHTDVCYCWCHWHLQPSHLKCPQHLQHLQCFL